MPAPETAYALGHADEWADWTPAGAEEAADLIQQLVAQRDGLVKALSAASEEIAACAEVIKDGDGAVIHTLLPQAARLVDLATSLLDQALDALREDGAEHTELAEQIEDALGLLPDRHADPAEASA